MWVKNLLVMVIILLLCGYCATAGDKDKIRQPMVAGSFYPADPAELKTMVDQFIAHTGSHKISGRIMAIISPHAGYIYSGHVAAEGYSLLKGSGIKRVIVIGPSHIEAEFEDKLITPDKLLMLSSEGHETKQMGRGEHSLEVQLPFLQRALHEFTLVPIIMGDQAYETCRSLGLALASTIHDSTTLIV